MSCPINLNSLLICKGTFVHFIFWRLEALKMLTYIYSETNKTRQQTAVWLNIFMVTGKTITLIVVALIPSHVMPSRSRYITMSRYKIKNIIILKFGRL